MLLELLELLERDGMDPRRAVSAAELHAEGVAFDAAQTERQDRRRNVKPDTAALLGILVKASRARRVLEIGTSNSYSTLWLTDAPEHTGDNLTSLDIHPGCSAQANLKQAGPASRTELLLLDADRSASADSWPDLLRLLRRTGGTLVVDDVRLAPRPGGRLLGPD